jgi:hypothetical protein
VLAKPPTTPAVIACNLWLQSLVAAGHTVYLPEIADYELRRELLHLRIVNSIVLLNKLKSDLEYLPISTDAMLLAADLWAQARRSGRSTADPKAIDAGCPLGADPRGAGIDQRRRAAIHRRGNDQRRPASAACCIRPLGEHNAINTNREATTDFCPRIASSASTGGAMEF